MGVGWTAAVSDEHRRDVRLAYSVCIRGAINLANLDRWRVPQRATTELDLARPTSTCIPVKCELASCRVHPLSVGLSGMHFQQAAGVPCVEDVRPNKASADRRADDERKRTKRSVDMKWNSGRCRDMQQPTNSLCVR